MVWEEATADCLSQLFTEILSFSFRETNARLIESYCSLVTDDVAEQISQNYKPFVAILVRCSIFDLLGAHKIRTGGIHPEDIDADRAWRMGLESALQRISRTADSYNAAMSKCLAAVDDYSLKYEADRHRTVGPPTDRYFSACQHFSDLIVALDSKHRVTVFRIAKDVFEFVRTICTRVPKMYELAGT